MMKVKGLLLAQIRSKTSWGKNDLEHLVNQIIDDILRDDC